MTKLVIYIYIPCPARNNSQSMRLHASGTHVNCRKIRMRHGYRAKPRTKFLKSEGMHTKAFTPMIPRRNQRKFLNQADTGNGPEKKNCDVVGSFTAPTGSQWTAGQVLNLIPQGTGDGSRIGRKILMKSVQFRYICKESALAPSPSQNRFAP